MQKEDLKSTLIDFGLSEHEASVYLASLSLGPSTVNEIAKVSGVKRTTVYPVIESLKQKGIMNIEVKGLKQLFVAESPERLEIIIEQKKDRLKDMIPELQAIYNLKSGGSLIKYYEGIEGVKTVYNSILLNDLKLGGEYLVISDMKRYLDMDKEFFENYMGKRAKFNLKTRLILQNNESGFYYKKFEQNLNHKIKIFDKKVDLKVHLLILKNKVIISQIVDPMVSIVIENKSIVEMQRQQFNIIWDAIS